MYTGIGIEIVDGQDYKDFVVLESNGSYRGWNRGQLELDLKAAAPMATQAPWLFGGAAAASAYYATMP